MLINNVHDFRRAIRNGPYAWPGGYPLFFIVADCETLSFETVKKNRRRCLEAIRDHSDDQFRPICLTVNWEDNSLTCADSNEKIECVYPEEAS